jgi:fumarate hydratase class I
MGAGWCRRNARHRIGGTAEKAMLLAKESLMERSTWPSWRRAARSLSTSRVELYDKVNALGIGAQGRRPLHRARREDPHLSAHALTDRWR